MIQDKTPKSNARFQPYKINTDKSTVPLHAAYSPKVRNSKPLQQRNENAPPIGIKPNKTFESTGISKKYDFKTPNKQDNQQTKIPNANPAKIGYFTPKTSMYAQNVYPTMMNKTPPAKEAQVTKFDVDLSLKMFTTTVDNLRHYSKHQKVYSILFEVFGMLPFVLVFAKQKISKILSSSSTGLNGCGILEERPPIFNQRRLRSHTVYILRNRS
jgi:hypothetical protein